MKNLIASFIILFILLAWSCNSTQIISSWKDPSIKIHPGEWKKVLVVALLKNETHRRRAEDEMVKFLDGTGITSYSYLKSNQNPENEEILRTKLKTEGFDAAITMRLIDVDKEKIYTPEQHYLYPVHYHTFNRYYYRSWLNYTTPGYYTETKKYIIETIVYSIQNDKIIWSGITETYDPQKIEKLTDEIACVIHKRMLKEGFIEK